LPLIATNPGDPAAAAAADNAVNDDDEDNDDDDALFLCSYVQERS